MSANQTNDIWLKQLAKGDDNAYEQLFKQNYTPLVLFADSYINDTELAKDMVQGMFLSLFCNKEIFSSIDKFKSYLYTTIKSKCLKHIRHDQGKDKHSTHIGVSEEDDDFWNKVLEEEIYYHLFQIKTQCPGYFKNGSTLSTNSNNKDITVFKLAELIAISLTGELSKQNQQIVKKWQENSIYNTELLRSFNIEYDSNVKFSSYSEINCDKDYNNFIIRKNKKIRKIRSFIQKTIVLIIPCSKKVLTFSVL